MEAEQEEDVKYTTLEDLEKPIGAKEQLMQTIKTGFQAPDTEWKQHF